MSEMPVTEMGSAGGAKSRAKDAAKSGARNDGKDEAKRQRFFAGQCRELLAKRALGEGRPLTCHIQTFGCQMNVRDSEKLLGALLEMGYAQTDSEDADFVVYNTCTVRENANLRVYGRLGQLGKKKETNPDMLIALCGCMMQEAEEVEKVRKSYRFVDIVFGTHNLHRLPELVWRRISDTEPGDGHDRVANGSPGGISGSTLQNAAISPPKPKGNTKTPKTKQVIEVWDIKPLPGAQGTANAQQKTANVQQETANVQQETANARSASSSEAAQRGDDDKFEKDQADTAGHAWDSIPDIMEPVSAARKYSFKTGVNIMYGCDNYCTYCIVPYVRGRERSRRPEDILAEIRALAADGVVEVMLLGQNVNSYGKGLEPAITFAGLLREIEAEVAAADACAGITMGASEATAGDQNKAGATGTASGRAGNYTNEKAKAEFGAETMLRLSGLKRIRFMTSHPKDLSDELIETMAASKALCRHVHLPMQSGSSAVLAKMNRHYTKESYLELVAKLRKAMPDISITTDIIVGFPGETEEDFRETLDVVRRVGFDSAFTFQYSPRSGTPAARMEGHVSPEVMKERFDRLLALVQETGAAASQRFVGTVQEVLAEEENTHLDGYLTGRMGGNGLVHFPGGRELIGQIIPVRITLSKGFYFYGERPLP
ncbi:MAG: radical SAM protein [Lachnospiraceae bacterium]|jgi:tRNA A37 methylthiotransferase MiaB|nr:radical SAM protein [Lachnospiraceae bacterium]